jgi:hypothetical protein
MVPTTYLSESFALESIFDTFFHAHARKTDTHGANVKPFMIEIIHHNPEPVVFQANQMIQRNTRVLKIQIRCACIAFQPKPKPQHEKRKVTNLINQRREY